MFFYSICSCVGQYVFAHSCATEHNIWAEGREDEHVHVIMTERKSKLSFLAYIVTASHGSNRSW